MMDDGHPFPCSEIGLLDVTDDFYGKGLDDFFKST